MNPVFTRYLYIKEEVEYAFFLSLVEKRAESSLFWAFELYHSGFSRETFELLWYIYGRFYEETNPKFKNLFEKKEKDFLTSLSKEEQESIFGSIVYNLVKRNVSFKVTKTTIKNTILREKYKKRNTKKTKKSEEPEEPKESEEPKEEPKESKLYVVLSCDDVKKFQTQTTTENSLKKCIPPRQILSLAIQNAINESKWFSSCSLARKSIPQEKMREMYHYEWLYHASFSPVWRERIEKNNGQINHEKRKVEFNEENDLDNFYNSFGYEPDEQKKEIQEKNIPVLAG